MPPDPRLDSWKAIASHLNRHVTTVRRWEKHEGLPVHRHLHDKLGSVYAYASEIDAWWRSRSADLDGRRIEAGRPNAAAQALTSGGPLIASRLGALLAGIAAMCALAAMGDSMGSRPLLDAARTATALPEGAPARAATAAAERQVDPAAYQEYLVGRYHLWRDTEEHLQRAIVHFERATRLDPDYALAYAGLGHAWWKRGLWGRGRVRLADAEAPARAAARRALELDDRLAAAYVVLAELERLYRRDLVRAEGLILRALRLDAGDVEAHYSYGLLLMELGRFPEAIEHMGTAAALEPLAPAIQSDFGQVLYRARKYDEAAARLRLALALEPDMGWLVQLRLAAVHEQTGQYEQALAALQRAATGNAVNVPRVARVLALMGRRFEARHLLAATPPGGPPASLRTRAAAYAAIGDVDAAFELLFDTIDDGHPGPNFVAVDPAFDSLRSDPRWPELLRRLRTANGTILG